MNSHQLRLAQHESLTRLSEVLTERLLKVLCSELLFKFHRKQIGDSLASSIPKLLGQYFQTYDTCGCSPDCDKGLTPSAWNKKRIDPYSDAIYETPARRLIICGNPGIEGLLRDLLGATSRSVAELTGGHFWPVQQIRAALAQTIKETLGGFLFESPVCQKAEICQSRRALNPWEAPAV
jgi:hypothetical protein